MAEIHDPKGLKFAQVGPQLRVATALTAAGSSISDALQLTARVNIVGTAAASTGVKLPQDVEIGEEIIVQNLGASDLEVYPPSASENFNSAAGGVALTLAAATDVILRAIKTSATTWVAFVVAGPAT